MVDFNLSERQRQWQQLAKEYAQTAVAPIIRDYERRPDPLDCMTWPAMKDAHRVGLRTLTVPKEWGGAGESWLTRCLAAEEVGVADAGTATNLWVNWLYFPMLFDLMTPEQRERFLRPHVQNPVGLLAPCLTEPNSGSDNTLPYMGLDGGMRSFAARDGNGWVINGRKHFTSSGGSADLYMLFVRTDLSRPQPQSTTLFVVTPDTPGFTIVRAHDKSAHRTSTQTEEVFEDLRVSDEHRVGPVGGYAAAAQPSLYPGAPCLSAATCIGTGRGALELALAYAREPGNGGRALLQEQAVAMMLAEMSMRLEAARYVVWNAAWRGDQGDLSDPFVASRARVLACEAGFDVARMAVEIFAERGIQTEYDVERYLRDACAGFHDPGTNQVHQLRVAMGLGHQPA